MNFVSYLKDIQDKLFRRSRYPGCYVYSRNKNDSKYKLGMSEADIFGRTTSAKFCFPTKMSFTYISSSYAMIKKR